MVHVEAKRSQRRVRQPVANSRHIGNPPLAAIFIFPHSSAQARIRSLDALGSDGGGMEVSTGGTGFSGAGDAGGGAAIDGARCCGF